MIGKDGYPILAFESPAAWRSWLAERHETATGVWVQMAKKGTGIASITYDEALDVALCFGWIDSQKGSLDESYWLQRFTPRRPGSRWSRVNRTRVTALVESGAMQPAGQREVEQAQADGRWDAAYESQRTATVPEDLRIELERNQRAREFFSTLDSANRYAILYRIQDAKTPQTRARRIAQFVQMLSEGKKLHP